MAHSTGHYSRLNRFVIAENLNKKDRAKEELIAELAAAISGTCLGITTEVQEGNAAYLKHWLRSLEEEPEYLMSIIGEVMKACRMIGEYTQIDGEGSENLA